MLKNIILDFIMYALFIQFLPVDRLFMIKDRSLSSG